jgi:hypothetical protein
MHGRTIVSSHWASNIRCPSTSPSAGAGYEPAPLGIRAGDSTGKVAARGSYGIALEIEVLVLGRDMSITDQHVPTSGALKLAEG